MNIPVLLICFNRPEHTRRTLDALLVQNPRELYVFQDGPRIGNELDLANCVKVRQIIEDRIRNSQAIVHANYEKINRGCRDAIIYAISSVLKKHEAVIVLEDDVITSPAFLDYMNASLEYYRDRESVFSISGESPFPEVCSFPQDYNYAYDVFCFPRQFNWGWGTWRDRWEKVDWTMSYYNTLINDKSIIGAFCRGGDDLLPMLTNEKEGRSSAWDIQFAFAHFMNHAISIVPCLSYTHNIGLDGSGTHCLENMRNEFDVKLLNQKKSVNLLGILYEDRLLCNIVYSAHCFKKRPLWQKACNWISRKLRKQVPFVIKKRIYA